METLNNEQGSIQQSFHMIHVEVCLHETSIAKHNEVREQTTRFLHSRESFILKIAESNVIEIPKEEDYLAKNVKTMTVYCEPKFHFTSGSGFNGAINFSFRTPNTFSQVFIHVFQLNEDEGTEDLEGTDSSACNQIVLPSKDFQGLWDSLVFDDDIKINLLDYVSTTMLFSDEHVDSDIVSWNRVVLLHGPPGTGKTSLCKALAQKLSIRLSSRYSHGQLIEINSHSLFSKWFSESGKLVMKLFSKIRELIEEKDSFVCVLIDEVESLTAARKAVLSGTEPSDAIRVVNALLTQIDQLKNSDNALILTTSNITGAIDLAFVDRADIKQFIGLPSVAACYYILSSCLNELMRVGIITPRQTLLDYRSVELLQQVGNEATKMSQLLLQLSQKCLGLSGRAIRKLPFLAHAFYIQSHCTLEQFLYALNMSIEREYKGRSKLES